MTSILVLGAVAVGAFVFGVLFGRRNTKKVETAVTDVKAEVNKVSGGKVNI